MKYLRFTLLICVAALASCGSTPARQVGTQAAAEVVEAQVTRLEPSSRVATEEAAAIQPSQATSQPGRGGYLEGDGPGADAPANLDATPDAEPKAEPLHRYANRPYAALGKTYTPLQKTGSYKERGIASWYGKKFHGQRTSSGETYDMYGMTAAHPILPIPSYARVTNVANGKSVVVRVNDRGPFLHDRIMDLSYTAAHKLGIVGNGSAEVEVESLATDVAVVAPLAQGEPVTATPLEPAAPAATSAMPPATAAAPAAAGNTYLQLGAFKSQQGAESFLARMRDEFGGSGKEVMLFQKDDLVRVHIGPYASAEEARAIAEKVQSRLGFKPIISPH